MLAWGPIRYARNGDVSIAYAVGGEGPVDLLFVGGFVSHLEIGTVARLKTSEHHREEHQPCLHE
jgi:hypothetical protein